jgi:hypothetical protein
VRSTGERLVGDGAGFVDPVTTAYDFPATIHGSVPLASDGNTVTDGATPTGWRASATNNTGASRNIMIVSHCAT